MHEKKEQWSAKASGDEVETRNAKSSVFCISYDINWMSRFYIKLTAINHSIFKTNIMHSDEKSKAEELTDTHPEKWLKRCAKDVRLIMCMCTVISATISESM